MKQFVFLYSLLALFSCSTSVEHTYKKTVQWNKFSWVHQEIGGVYFEKSGICLPLKLDTISYNFKCELSLGQQHTEIYENVVNKLVKEIPSFSKFVDKNADSTSPISLSSGKLHYLRFTTGTYSFIGNANLINQLQNKDSSLFLMLNDTVMLGSLGVDFFKDQFLIIDYKTQQYTIVDTLPQLYSTDDNFVPMLMLNNKLLLPFQINGKMKNFIFESGSAMFDFLTTEATWNSMIDSTKPNIDYVSIAALGSYYKIFSGTSNATIAIAGKTIRKSQHTIYYPVRPDFAEYLRAFNAYGVVGSKLFENTTIVLDFKQKRFGVFL